MEYSREPVAIGERLLWSGEITVAHPRAYGLLTVNPRVRTILSMKAS
jgi:hypothetical protein